MAVVLSGFLGYHLYLLLRGTTTNESAKWSEVCIDIVCSCVCQGEGGIEDGEHFRGFSWSHFWREKSGRK